MNKKSSLPIGQTGPNSIRTTQIYTHVSTSILKGIVSPIEKLTLRNV